MMGVFAALCFVLVVSLVDAQTPVSPCPRIFRYENDGYRWFGTIEAPSPPPYGSEMTIKIRMIVRALLPSAYVGKIELAEDRDLVLQKIAQNMPMKYKVTFPLTTPLPTVAKITFAGRRLCTGEPVFGRFITAVDLEHTLHSGASALKNSLKENLVIGGNIPNTNSRQPPYPDYPEPVQNSNTRDQVSYSSSNAQNPPLIQYPQNPTVVTYTVNPSVPINTFNQNPIPDSADFNKKPSDPDIDSRNVFTGDDEIVFKTPEVKAQYYRDGICGTTKIDNPLIVNGDFASKGDWPWLVAMFIKKLGGLQFICSGSLVSETKVVTAAHCVKRKTPQDFVLKLGVHNIQDWTEETAITKSVIQIKIHEQYNIGALLNNDIAVMTLSQPVTYTNYIRPICLWSGDTDLDKVVGLVGTVIGWGKDEQGAPATAEPKIAKIPIVSTMTCKASRVEFFKLTSETTLCAGSRDGTGPCNGDSGGGLYLRQGGRWALRGIVSKSLKDPETLSCDLSEFVVYTDAAKFEDFIR